MQVRTTHTEQVWQSPDGKRKIWEVNLQDEQGKDYRLKTYSPEIGSMGFKGEVKSFLNKFGERFVRQVTTAADRSGGYNRDDSAIRAQWAIGQAINLASVKMDKDEITLPIIERYAKELFATVSRVKGENLTPEQQVQAEAYIKDFTGAAI